MSDTKQVIFLRTCMWNGERYAAGDTAEMNDLELRSLFAANAVKVVPTVEKDPVKEPVEEVKATNRQVKKTSTRKKKGLFSKKTEETEE